MASSASSSVKSMSICISFFSCVLVLPRDELDDKFPRIVSDPEVPLSARRAAAQAHSSVRRVRWCVPKFTYSRSGGLLGGASGDEGMLSHIAALGL